MTKEEARELLVEEFGDDPLDVLEEVDKIRSAHVRFSFLKHRFTDALTDARHTDGDPAERENPPTFHGRYDPDGAKEWLKEIKRILRVMDYSTVQKVRYGTHMLAGEADDWWVGTRQRLEAIGEVITWVVFTREFMRKYFTEDVRGKKETEFLALKQGNSTVTEYAAKFVELVKFYLHYSICRFAELVNNCQIYEEDNIAHSAHYKSLNEKRGKPHHDRKNPYDAPDDKGKQKVTDGKKTSGGGAPATVRCYRYGEQGHFFNKCENKVIRCYRCGKIDHRVPDYKDDGPTCFNYAEHGHISTQCQKSKKDGNSAKTNVAIIDTGGTHSFISVDCATMLGLQLSSMNGSMECPLTIFDKSFVMDLVCLPLHQIDVIFGINWLEFNYIHINCYNKTLRFSKFGDNRELMLLTAKQVSECLRDEAVIFAIFALLQSESEATSIGIPVVGEFPEVFPNDISDFPPEHEVEFSIELVPATSPVSMTPYRMLASELNELKKQLEDMLEKMFV
ncbi:uncharacterized protein LOC131658968 [Vicia villosa]|uniref:uncharacterized protein LOC131658968 n=1 Tax=Vicia villosa TaxID=3911 RepID=UPI00273CF2AF|nr:uncharacterized protein LOC131658968 [Vicia villosa]